MTLFRDRREAGRKLAEHLHHYAGSGAIVIAVPRGGVPVASEVATSLALPLDVLVVRKLGVPGLDELALSAVGNGGVRVPRDGGSDDLGIPAEVVGAVIRREGSELQRRHRAYRGGRPPLDVRWKTTILVDDGLATGTTMRAAVRILRARRAARVVAAVPVGAPETCDALAAEADEVVCALTPQPFLSVGYWYDSFPQTTDAEVQVLLARNTVRREA
jgi:predicted phosphoribosyltransferase